MKTVKQTAVAVALGSVALGAALPANAQINLFGFEALDTGYQVVDSEGKCGEGKCGDAAKATSDKTKEGQCGANMQKAGDKAKEGQCGAEMKKTAEQMDSKTEAMKKDEVPKKE